jgi:DNA helicase II / ATP-dependent DNA helicase PcrA
MAGNPHAEHLNELLEGLNEPQREAVTHGDGPLLILAGAGSGKTRVLTHRVAHLIFTDQAQPGEILAITFTNKAAREMSGRVEALLGRRTRGMWLMTFHAACARILRADADRLGYTRQFTIYDQADSRRLVRRCADAAGVDPKRYTPAMLHNQISAAKNRLRAAADVRAGADSPFLEMLADVYELYERDLLRMNALDFDDLLFRCVNLFELFDDVRARYRANFRHVLVDEYQDTNFAQYRLLQLLVADEPLRARERARGMTASDEPEGGFSPTSEPGTAPHRNLAVVGDDSQSIYSFRGAEIRNILDFQEHFPDAHVVRLEQNYRSTGTILRAANAVIANNRGGIAKRLWSELGTGDPVHLRVLDDEHAEARFVVGEVERLIDEGTARSDIAVLYRTNAASRVIEDALVRRDIGYQVIGGTKFYERAEIKDAIAYLTLLVNPHDVVSFTRIVNSPRRGIGQTSLARVLAHANAIDVSVWQAASEPQSIPGLAPAAAKALERFMSTMAELRALAGLSDGPDGDGEGEDGAVGVAELLQATLTRSGYLEALEAERTIEAEGRIENLEQLVVVGEEFDAAVAEAAAEGEAPLQLFLQQVALVADADARSDDDSLVTLMTLHNAKGLEYEVVFICGLEDGVFPHSRALDEGSLEEERRLFYVGITRAMRQLYLSYARRRAAFGAPMSGVRSRFLDEIPGGLVDEVDSLERFRPGLGGGEIAARAGGGGAGRAFAERDSGAPSWSAARAREPAAITAFRLGEDVVHAAFGEGVVTGVEADGVIVVRFAGDGSERKLMAEYAPVSRR